DLQEAIGGCWRPVCNGFDCALVYRARRCLRSTGICVRSVAESPNQIAPVLPSHEIHLLHPPLGPLGPAWMRVRLPGHGVGAPAGAAIEPAGAVEPIRQAAGQGGWTAM